MSGLFNTLQERYQVLVARKEKGETREEFLEDVSSFIADAQRAGAVTADLGERSQLRAWMRFLANTLYDATGTYPDTSLQPLARGQLIDSRPERREKPAPLSPLAWVLIGGAVIVIVTLFSLWQPWGAGEMVTPSPLPTPTPTARLAVAVQAAVGGTLTEEGTLAHPGDTFCLGTSEIIAEFTLDGVQPETKWYWEVHRNDEIVASQPETLWGRSESYVTVPVLRNGPEGVEAGDYRLLIYAGGEVVSAVPFRVLETPPRIYNLRVSDVPEPVSELKEPFASGLRIIYLSYEHEGMCQGLEVVHHLYYEGDLLQERAIPWSDAPEGTAQISFQAPGDQPFLPGDYEVAVAVAGEEQDRVGFTIRKSTGDMGARSAFGAVTIALGVQPDGTPILTAPDRGFDWNTKVVYAIFDYVGMSDGLAWMAVWSRNGQEVAREEHFWDAETDGTDGTRWVAYYDEDGRTLPGGDYSVTLYIRNVAQRTAEFSIRFYVPPE